MITRESLRFGHLCSFELNSHISLWVYLFIHYYYYYYYYYYYVVVVVVIIVVGVVVSYIQSAYYIVIFCAWSFIHLFVFVFVEL